MAEESPEAKPIVMLDVIEFVRPNGVQVPRQIAIHSEAFDYLQSLNAAVTTENIGNQTIVYFDVGLKTEDDEPDELTYFWNPAIAATDFFDSCMHLIKTYLAQR